MLYDRRDWIYLEQDKEEEARRPEDKESEILTAGVESLSIETAETEEKVTEGLEAVLDMDI